MDDLTRTIIDPDAPAHHLLDPPVDRDRIRRLAVETLDQVYTRSGPITDHDDALRAIILATDAITTGIADLDIEVSWPDPLRREAWWRVTARGDITADDRPGTWRLAAPATCGPGPWALSAELYHQPTIIVYVATHHHLVERAVASALASAQYRALGVSGDPAGKTFWCRGGGHGLGPRPGQWVRYVDAQTATAGTATAGDLR